jgi:hypothetical protein
MRVGDNLVWSRRTSEALVDTFRTFQKCATTTPNRTYYKTCSSKFMISMAGDGKLFTTIASGIKRWREQLLRH